MAGFALVPASPILSTSLGDPFVTRLEPQTITGDPQEGLAARTWDPLWLLGRQWQMGELVGEDAGTPVTVTIDARFDPITAWKPTAAGTWQSCPNPTNLQQLAESETVDLIPAISGGGPGHRARAQAAWALVDSLEQLDMAGAAAALIQRFPGTFTDHPEPAPGAATVADPWTTWATCLDTALPDPDDLAAAFTDPQPPEWWSRLVDGPHSVAAQDALDAWLTWYTTEINPTRDPTTNAWQPHNLEYDFQLSTEQHVLHAPGHPGGTIDWAGFDLEPGADPVAGEAPGDRRLTRTVLASPLYFPGMPANRFWEMEDASVDLGAVWADPHQLARLLVIECALVYGGDWLVLPVDTPRAGILTLDSVSYRDTFGTTWHVAATTPTNPDDRFTAPWRMFTVTQAAWSAGDADGTRVELPGLFIPPAPPGLHEGPPVEDLTFLRDETANLVWAVEHTVPGPSGDPITPTPTADDDAPPAAAQDPNLLHYQLMTRLPETWTPYVARIRGEPGHQTGQVDLIRSTMQLGATTTQPTGVLLASKNNRAEHARIDSAEVPRDGIRVQRIPIAAHHSDGTWTTWIARRVLAGSGEASSGLTFDKASIQ